MRINGLDCTITSWPTIATRTGSPTQISFFFLKEERFFSSSSFLSLLVSIVTPVIVAVSSFYFISFLVFFFLFLIFISFLLLLVVGLGCFIRFGLDPTRPAFAFLRVRVIEGRVFSPSVRTDDGERNLSIVQSRPNGLCPTPAQIRPRATRSTFALSPLSFVWFFFLFVVLSLTAAHKRWKRRHLHSSFFLFVVVLLFLFDSSLWNVSLFLHAPRV